MQKTKKRYTFGLLIDWITGWEDNDYYQSLIVSGLSDFAIEKDINVMCFVTGRVDSPNEWERCRNLLFQFVDQNKVDGLIVPTPAMGIYSDSEGVYKLLQGYPDIPIVTIGEKHPSYHSVTIDNYSGMRQIVNHLIEDHLYKRIAFVKGPCSNETTIRFQAYCDALQDHGIEYDPQLVCKGNYLFESGAEAVRTFKRMNILYDALVCSNDNMAMGALIEYNNQKEHRVPITGFDDIENSKLYALTTVRQSFYDETQKAAEMLFNILEGNETPLHLEIPSVVVIRTSCGCISSTVRETFLDPARSQCNDSYETLKSNILCQLNELNYTLGLGNEELSKEILSYEHAILNAFEEEFLDSKKDRFIFAWENLILWAVHRKMNYSFTQDILSSIRKNIVLFLSSEREIIKAENIFHAARVHIFDSLQSSGRHYFNPLENDNSDLLGEELMASLDYSSQMKSVCQVLPRLGIEMCYIALFQDPQAPLKKSRLIQGLNKRACYNQGSTGIVFMTLDLLPEVFLEDLYTERFSIIVQVLYQGDNLLGYVILSFDKGINKNYEIIRYRLSVSLKGTMLIDRITKQAADLERQVIERTKELSLSNHNLMEEVEKRRDVEKQLKKALKELGYYNEQLHVQSIRDDLTQLYNRRGFIKLGLECYQRAKDNACGLLMLYADLDGLKRINDQFGHNEGDYAISRTAEILNESFRSTDIISRFGGDEFTILVIDALPKDEHDIRQRIDGLCCHFNETRKKPYKLSMSIGAAYFTPDSDLSFEDLIKLADMALYEDKQKKRQGFASLSISLV